ncbi:MAG: type II/IV secretion system protein [Desulfobacterales bacterium]|nr:type II/IV secretion system protein [Desulfobacterales bacterium]
MVTKITDQGLVLQHLPLPVFRRLIPFDELEKVELIENRRQKQIIIHRAGTRPIVLKRLAPDLAEKIVSELNEILDPLIAKQDKALMFDETESITAALCSQRGIRPSVLLSFLINQAMFHRATDLHFEYMKSQYRARFRIDSILHDVAVIPESMKSRIVAYIKNEAGLIAYRRDIPQEGRLTFKQDRSDPVEMRLSIVPARGGESVVLRLFGALRGSLDLDSLGFSSKVRQEYGEILDKPRGMILLSGPSNSGKTTTIYASLQYLIKGPRAGERAVSLEDPVEFPIECASQIEVAPNKGLTFDSLLSNILRQDVEVIVVGEIRDATTAAIALRAALTGHLILSTVHCGRAAEVPRRLTDLGPGASEVAEAVTGVLTQRLLRVICPRCRTENPLTDAEQKNMQIPEWLNTVYKGQGCKYCMNTGYYGQTVIAELIQINDELAEMIRQNAPVSVIRQKADQLEMTGIRKDAFEKAAQGITSLEEIRRVLR